MAGDQAPFTYEKNFEITVSLKFTSQQPLDSVTAESVVQSVTGRLTHSDGQTDTIVKKAETAPSSAHRILARLEEIQTILNEIKFELSI